MRYGKHVRNAFSRARDRLFMESRKGYILDTLINPHTGLVTLREANFVAFKKNATNREFSSVYSASGKVMKSLAKTINAVETKMKSKKFEAMLNSIHSYFADTICSVCDPGQTQVILGKDSYSLNNDKAIRKVKREIQSTAKDYLKAYAKLFISLTETGGILDSVFMLRSKYQKVLLSFLAQTFKNLPHDDTTFLFDEMTNMFSMFRYIHEDQESQSAPTAPETTFLSVKDSGKSVSTTRLHRNIDPDDEDMVNEPEDVDTEIEEHTMTRPRSRRSSKRTFVNDNKNHLSSSTPLDQVNGHDSRRLPTHTPSGQKRMTKRETKDLQEHTFSAPRKNADEEKQTSPVDLRVKNKDDIAKCVQFLEALNTLKNSPTNLTYTGDPWPTLEASFKELSMKQLVFSLLIEPQICLYDIVVNVLHLLPDPRTDDTLFHYATKISQGGADQTKESLVALKNILHDILRASVDDVTHLSKTRFEQEHETLMSVVRDARTHSL